MLGTRTRTTVSGIERNRYEDHNDLGPKISDMVFTAMNVAKSL